MTARNTLSGRARTSVRVPRVPDLADIPLIKGMLIRGDIQSDIAAYFGTNGGRICEINTGQAYSDVPAAPPETLPPPGPYLSARSALLVQHTLVRAIQDMQKALGQVQAWESI